MPAIVVPLRIFLAIILVKSVDSKDPAVGKKQLSCPLELQAVAAEYNPVATQLCEPFEEHADGDSITEPVTPNISTAVRMLEAIISVSPVDVCRVPDSSQYSKVLEDTTLELKFVLFKLTAPPDPAFDRSILKNVAVDKQPV